MSGKAPRGAYLSRQPILDLRQDLIGYELTIQSGRDLVRYSPESAAMLVCAVYAELGVRSALGRHKAFLRVPPEFLHDDVIEALPSDGVVLELALNHAPSEETLERCRELRERRYSLALIDYEGLDERSSPLLTMLDFIKVNAEGKGARELLALAGPLARLPVRLIAQARTREDFFRCRETGFQYFQGNFFARREAVSGRRLAASQANLVRLLNLAAQDADTPLIEEGIKHDPALAIKLLSIVNSAAQGLPRRIGSLRQAVIVLGRRQLRRWLHLLLMTPDGKPADIARTPLLQVAALRGRMLEVLASRVRPNEAELGGQAFITGLMSMMPLALGMPMEEIFEQIELEPEIVAALQSLKGPLGKLLALIECYDAEDTRGCDRILSEFSAAGMDRNTLNACLVDALRWVNADVEA